MADNLTVRTDTGPAVGSSTPEKSGKSELDQRLDSLRARVSEKFGKQLGNDDRSNDKLKVLLNVATARAARAERQSAQTESVKNFEKSTSTEQLTKGSQKDGIALALGAQDKAEHGLSKEQARAVASDPNAPAMLPRAEAPQISAQKGKELATSILGMLQTEDGPLTLEQFRDSIKQRPATVPGETSTKTDRPTKTDTPSQSDTSGEHSQQQPPQARETLSQLGQQVKAPKTGDAQQTQTPAQSPAQQTQTPQPTRPSSGDTSQQGQQQQSGKQTLAQLGQQSTRAALPQSKSLASLTTLAQTGAGARAGLPGMLPTPAQTRAQGTTRPTNGDATPPAPSPATTATTQTTPPSRTTPGQPTTTTPGPATPPNQPNTPGQTTTAQQKGQLGQLAQQAAATPGTPAKPGKTLVGLFNDVVSQPADTPEQPVVPQQPGPSRPNTPQQPVATRAAQSRPTNGDAAANAAPTPTPTPTPAQPTVPGTTTGQTRPTSGDATGGTTGGTTTQPSNPSTATEGELGQLFNEATGQPAAGETQAQAKPGHGKFVSMTTEDRVPSQPGGNAASAVASDGMLTSLLTKVVQGGSGGTTKAETTPPKTTPPTTTPPQQTTPRPGSQSGGFGSPVTRAAPMGAETSGTRLSLRGIGQKTVRDGPTNLGGGLESTLEFDGMHFNWDAFYLKFMAKYQKNEFKARQAMAELRDMMHKLAVESIEARIALEKMNQAFERAEAASELGTKVGGLFTTMQEVQQDKLFGKNPESVVKTDKDINDLLNPTTPPPGTPADKRRSLFQTEEQIQAMDPETAKRYRGLLGQRDVAAGDLGQVQIRQRALDETVARKVAALQAPGQGGGMTEPEARAAAENDPTIRALRQAYEQANTRAREQSTKVDPAAAVGRAQNYNRAAAGLWMPKKDDNRSLFVAARDPDVVGKINLSQTASAYSKRVDLTRTSSADRARIESLKDPALVTSARDMAYEQAQAMAKGNPRLEPFFAATPAERETLRNARSDQDVPQDLRVKKAVMDMFNNAYDEPFSDIVSAVGDTRNRLPQAPAPSDEAWKAIYAMEPKATTPAEQAERRNVIQGVAGGIARNSATEFITSYRQSEHNYATDGDGRLQTRPPGENEIGPQPRVDETNTAERTDYLLHSDKPQAVAARRELLQKAGQKAGQNPDMPAGPERDAAVRDQIKKHPEAVQNVRGFEHSSGLRDPNKNRGLDKALSSVGAISGVSESLRRDMEKSAAELTAAAQRGGSEVDQRLRSQYAQSQGLLAQMTQILNIGRSR